MSNKLFLIGISILILLAILNIFLTYRIFFANQEITVYNKARSYKVIYKPNNQFNSILREYEYIENYKKSFLESSLSNSKLDIYFSEIGTDNRKPLSESMFDTKKKLTINVNIPQNLLQSQSKSQLQEIIVYAILYNLGNPTNKFTEATPSDVQARNNIQKLSKNKSIPFIFDKL